MYINFEKRYNLLSNHKYLFWFSQEKCAPFCDSRRVSPTILSQLHSLIILPLGTEEVTPTVIPLTSIISVESEANHVLLTRSKRKGAKPWDKVADADVRVSGQRLKTSGSCSAISMLFDER